MPPKRSPPERPGNPMLAPRRRLPHRPLAAASYTAAMALGPRFLLAAALAVAAGLLLARRRRPTPSPAGTWRPVTH